MAAPTTDSAGITRVVRALARDGWTVYGVNGGDDMEPMSGGLRQAVDTVLDYDDAFMYVHKEVDGERQTGWVRFVMGNSPEEVAADYTVNLTAVEAETETWWR